VLPAGTHTLWVTFTPENPGDASVQASVTINVTKATPTIDWQTPSLIPSGTPLGAAHLNATASAAGTLVYSPSEGELLAPGKHTLSVAFIPEDETEYTTAEATVSVTVAKTTPTITWPAPAPVSFGASLSAAQLNANASVPGTIVYTPGPGDVLAVGKHTLALTFTPKDDTNYAPAHATVTLSVVKATPAIAWPAPAPFTYGTPLNASQLEHLLTPLAQALCWRREFIPPR
jgi:hypothetical protein